MLRACGRDDVPAILGIINAAAARYEGVIPDDCWQRPYMPAAALAQEIARGVAFTGWEAAGGLQGVMGAQRVGAVMLIRHAYVLPACQNQGIGHALLSHLLAGAAAPVLVGTWADATWAIAFYRKHGFSVTSPQVSRKLLARFWTVPERQVAASMVLLGPGAAAALGM